jgi:uncharacterized repeat protein (TIGR01451 family)
LGGAVFNHGGSVSAVNCTFSANTVTGGAGSTDGAGSTAAEDGQGLGGAIFSRNGSLTVTSCTFAANDAQAGGGIFVVADGEQAVLDLTSSILADTTGAATDLEVAENDGGTALTDGGLGFNLVESQTGYGGSITVTSDPLLGPLADNGGATPTHGLDPTSPAIDAGIGTAVSSDQRGAARPIDLAGISNASDGADIGALEYGVDLVVSKSADAITVTVGATLTYTATVTNLGPDTAVDVEFEDVFPEGVAFLSAESTKGEASLDEGKVVCSVGVLEKDEAAVVTIVVSVQPEATQLSNTAAVTGSRPEPNELNNTDTVVTEVAAGDGSLFVKKSKFTINWAKHLEGAPADSMSINGALNPNGLKKDLSGATVEILVNGVALVPPTALDAKGKAKSAKGATPVVKLTLSAKKLSISLKSADLRAALGLQNETRFGTAELRIQVNVEGAGLATETWDGLFDLPYESVANKKSTGSFSFKKESSPSGVFRSSKTKASEKAQSYIVSAKGEILAAGGGPVVPADGAGPAVVVKIGNATPIEIPFSGLVFDGSTAATTVVTVTKGAHKDIAKLTLDNKARKFSFKTNMIEDTGLPLPRAQDESLTFPLLIRIEVSTAVGLRIFATEVEVKRKKPSSGKWSG